MLPPRISNFHDSGVGRFKCFIPIPNYVGLVQVDFWQIRPTWRYSERAPNVRNLLEIARNQRIGPRALSGYPGIYLTPRGIRSRPVQRHMAEKRFQTKNPPKSRILVHAMKRFLSKKSFNIFLCIFFRKC